MLGQNGRDDVRVFVVWEPVLTTDWGTPSPALTSYVRSRGTMHFWDRQRRLSAMLGGAAFLDHSAQTRNIGFRMKDVVWDTAFVYAPGASWGKAATLLVAPVAKFQAELGRELSRWPH